MTVEEYAVLGEVNRHHKTAADELAQCKWWAIWRWAALRRAGRALERSKGAFDCYHAVKALFEDRS